jgi:cold shock CspA family protein
MKESLMKGIIKRFDSQGFGIIEGADGSKLPFIRSDFSRHQFPRAGLKVIFSIRRVKDKVFASNVFARREALNAV